MSEIEADKTRFYIDKTGFFAEAAVMLLALSAVFRLIGFIGTQSNDTLMAVELALPLLACLLMVLCLLLCGKKLFLISIVPVILGAVFFTFDAMDHVNRIGSVLRVLLCVLTAVIYCLTMLGVIRTKWLLAPIFCVLLVCRLSQDIPRLLDSVSVLSFVEGMREMSVLCMLTAMVFVGLGMKRIKPVPLPTVVGEEVETEYKLQSEEPDCQMITTHTETEPLNESEKGAEKTDEN